MSEGTSILKAIIEGGSRKQETVSEKLIYDTVAKPGFFGIPAFLKKLHDSVVEFFNESTNNSRIINDNIGKLLKEVRNIPTLHDELHNAELDIQLKNSLIAELEVKLEDTKAELDLKTEVLLDLERNDYFQVMQQALIEATKALRDGRDADFTELTNKFNEATAKVKSIL